MTHAVFCLYILDSYDKATAAYVVGQREKMMEGQRDFIRFRAFNQELIRLHQSQPARHAADLYPDIVRWCRNQR